MATIYRTILAKGFFPKELPPTFYTEQFARYATTSDGRAAIAGFRPLNSFTECTAYELALPGGARRPLAIPHPWSYAQLSSLVAKSFRRLLKKAAGSRSARSRPVYLADGDRAIRPQTKASNLGRERAVIRGGARYLLKVDISQFYPSLYTHAVGWAVDPKLRDRANWRNGNLLGKRLDQSLMDLQGKISQGIPIGTDVSFLLAEVVLAEVDKSIKLPPQSAVRWFDDYEIACQSVEEAERWLGRLQAAMARFRLKINSAKTKIIALPDAALDRWQTELVDAARRALSRPNEMLAFFDAAFRLRGDYPDAPVLNYALGLLFRVRVPAAAVAAIAQSSVTQCLLAEPGSAQKGLALLTFWVLNGLVLDTALLVRTVSQMITQQQYRGFSSDVAWALFFCLMHRLKPAKPAVEALRSCGDNAIVLQALHLRAERLLPKNFGSQALVAAAKQADLDGPDWLLLYEAHRQGFARLGTGIRSHALFDEMISRDVAFYRRRVPSYAAVIHPGGAPEWVVARWLQEIQHPATGDVSTAGAGAPVVASPPPVVATIASDVHRLVQRDRSVQDLIHRLLGVEGTDDTDEDDDAGVSYPV